MVTCFDCGYVALRNMENASLCEADEIYRMSGRAEHYGARMSNSPLCFQLVHRLGSDFNEELRRLHAAQVREEGAESANTPAAWNAAYQDAATATLRRDRKCCDWTLWQQGFSPKEHREMLDRQWQIERQRDWERQDREVQQSIARATRDSIAIASESAKAAKSAAHWQALAVVVAAITFMWGALCKGPEPVAVAPTQQSVPGTAKDQP